MGEGRGAALAPAPARLSVWLVLFAAVAEAVPLRFDNQTLAVGRDGLQCTLSFRGDVPDHLVPQVGGSASFLEEGAAAALEKESTIRIAQQEEFRAHCRCGKDVEPFSHWLMPFDVVFGKCAATKVVQMGTGYKMVDETRRRRIVKVKKPYGMNRDQVARAMGNPLDQKWVKAATHHVSDFSGRTEAPIVAFPGGDIALFIAALNVFMEMTEEPLDKPDCLNLLQQYLVKTEKASFYLPTDTSAVKLIASAFDSDSIDLTETPPEAAREKLLQLLTQPVNQGSSTLRVMLQRPEAFRLRHAQGGSLAACAIRAFFLLLWDKDDPASSKMRLVELEGDGEERAVVRVFTTLPCEAQGILPLVTPKSQQVCDNEGCKKQMHIVHPQAPTIMYEELSNFLASRSGKVEGKRMRDLLKREAERIQDVTSQAVLRPFEDLQLPLYNVYLE